MNATIRSGGTAALQLTVSLSSWGLPDGIFLERHDFKEGRMEPGFVSFGLFPTNSTQHDVRNRGRGRGALRLPDIVPWSGAHCWKVREQAGGDFQDR